jgi:hypothetical protein
MMLYSIILYLHVIATLVLSAALGIEIMTLLGLRRAAGVREARLGSDSVSGLRVIGTSSLVVLFLSGGFLTERISAWTLVWPKLAVAGVILFAALGAVSGRRLSAIRRMSIDDKATLASVMARLQDPVLSGALGIRIGIVLGLVLLMTAKPGALESLAILGGAVGLGLAASLLLSGVRATSISQSRV